MIFVDVGTDRFEELVIAVDEIAPSIKEKVIIKIGKGHYKPKNCEYYSFVPEIQPYYKKARLIIAHGGAGTTFNLLSMGKKIIGVSNPHKPDRHQEQILKALSKDGYLIWCKDLRNLLKLVNGMKRVKLKKYKAPECKINEIIEENIDRWFEK